MSSLGGVDMTQPGMALAEELKDILRELTSIDAIPGHERAVIDYLTKRLTPLVHKVETDLFGNLIAYVYLPRGLPRATSQNSFPSRDKTTKPLRRLLFAAHTDEIGFMVKSIEPDGFIRFDKVGVISDHFVIGRKVKVKGIPGVIGTKAGYLMTEKEMGAVVPHVDLYVDVGASSSQEVRDLGIEIGDPISFVSEFTEMKNSRVSCKALDDRAGCAVLLALAKEVSKKANELNSKLPVGHQIQVSSNEDTGCEIIFAFTTQEEMGCRGASVMAYNQQPDFAIVVDTVPAADTPGMSLSKDINVKLGGGPVIPVLSGSLLLGNIMFPWIKEYLISAAKRRGVPYQLAILPVAVTDSSVLQMARGGIPVGTVSIPRRYAHSPVELLDIGDLSDTLFLLLQVVEDFLSEEIAFFV